MAVLGFASLTANAYRIVGIGFSALSKPGQAHQKRTPLDATDLVTVRLGTSTRVRFWWTWRDSNPRPEPVYVNLWAFALTIIHCWPTKAKVFLE